MLFYPYSAKIIFGLDALNGRTIPPQGPAVGAWDSTNAESLIRYTVSKNYTIFGWELGKHILDSASGATAVDSFIPTFICSDHFYDAHTWDYGFIKLKFQFSCCICNILYFCHEQH